MNRLPENTGTGPLALAVLARFRREFHACLTGRADELCELADAVLCADGPVRNLAALSLAPGHRRGHGALYDAAELRADRYRAAAPVPGGLAVTAGGGRAADAGGGCE